MTYFKVIQSTYLVLIVVQHLFRQLLVCSFGKQLEKRVRHVNESLSINLKIYILIIHYKRQYNTVCGEASHSMLCKFLIIRIIQMMQVY
jgi:hypothetical protein